MKATIRMLILILLVLLLPLAAFVGFLTWNQARFILPARVNAVEKPAAALNAEYLTLTTPDGETLQGILYRPTSGKIKTLVLAFAGNTHNPIGFATWLHTVVIKEPDTAVAAFSYRGYPNGITAPSSGQPSQQAMYADSLFIYDTLLKSLNPQQVKVVGYSIGTAVGTYLATQRPVANLALVAPVASVRRIVQGKYPWLPVTLLLRHPFAVEDMLAQVSNPTTIIYTPTDGLIPEWHVTKILHAASPTIPQISITGTNHMTLVTSPELPEILRQALAK